MFIINKIDLATPDQITRSREIITSLHPCPDIIETSFAQVPLTRFIVNIRQDQGQPTDTEPVMYQELDAVIDAQLENPDPNAVPPDRLLSAVYGWHGKTIEEFKRLMNRLPMGIVRAKGIIQVFEGVYLFNRVMTRQTVEPYISSRNLNFVINNIVFIAPPEGCP